jgi:hypothetical protein
MSTSKSKPLPLSIDPIQKRMARAQFGALCYRIEKEMVQILLVTSRGTKRWIVPKGWPEDGLTPAEAAAREAAKRRVSPAKSNSVPSVFIAMKKIWKMQNPCPV